MNPRAILFLVLVIALGCGQPAEQSTTPTPGPGRVEAEVNRLVVVCVDGMDLQVARSLWASGELPAFQSLADRGLAAEFLSDYAISPIIWTTLATGVGPEVHGISDFVGETDGVQTPMSSTQRKAPAVWEMLSRLGRSVSVLGWYISWPAEEVNGTFISDRPKKAEGSWPAELRNQIKTIPDDPRVLELFADGDRDLSVVETDSVVMASASAALEREDDLTMIGIRALDAVSHRYWRYFSPESFPEEEISSESIAEHGDRIPAAYRVADQMLASILETVDLESTNVIVVSDHGHKASKNTTRRVYFDLDQLLVELGFLEFEEDGAIVEGSLARTAGAPLGRPLKPIEILVEDPAEKQRIKERLIDRLRSITFSNGKKAIAFPKPGEDQVDIDLLVRVRAPSSTKVIFDGDRRIEGVVDDIREYSGSHDDDTHGLIIAGGPDIERGADTDGMRIHDLTPTILYALGLPVARDFEGRPARGIFTKSFQSDHPVEVIKSWGSRDASGPIATEQDQEIIEELKSLGYLN